MKGERTVIRKLIARFTRWKSNDEYQREIRAATERRARR